MSGFSILRNLPFSRIKQFTADLSQAAGTYDLLAASGSGIYIKNANIYVSTAGATFTSVSIQTNQTTPKVILSSTDGAVANLTSQAQIENSIDGWGRSHPIYLASGQKWQYTIVGTTGTGALLVTVEFLPVTADGDLI